MPHSRPQRSSTCTLRGLLSRQRGRQESWAPCSAWRTLLRTSPPSWVICERTNRCNRMMSTSEDARVSIRSVHSLKQRMIWLEAEPCIFLHAVPSLAVILCWVYADLAEPQTVLLPRARRRTTSATTAASSTSSSAAASTSNALPPLEDAALTAMLKRAYRAWRLHYRALGLHGRDDMQARMEEWWSKWVEGFASSIERGTMSCVPDVIGGTISLPGKKVYISLLTSRS